MTLHFHHFDQPSGVDLLFSLQGRGKLNGDRLAQNNEHPPEVSAERSAAVRLSPTLFTSLITSGHDFPSTEDHQVRMDKNHASDFTHHPSRDR